MCSMWISCNFPLMASRSKTKCRLLYWGYAGAGSLDDRCQDGPGCNNRMLNQGGSQGGLWRRLETKRRGLGDSPGKHFQFKVAQPPFLLNLALYTWRTVYNFQHILEKQKLCMQNLFLPCRCTQPDLSGTLLQPFGDGTAAYARQEVGHALLPVISRKESQHAATLQYYVYKLHATCRPTCTAIDVGHRPVWRLFNLFFFFLV